MQFAVVGSVAIQDWVKLSKYTQFSQLSGVKQQQKTKRETKHTQ